MKNQYAQFQAVLAACTVLFVVSSLASYSQSLTNGFMRGEGRGSVALSYSFESYDRFWVGENEGDLPAGLGEITVESYNLWAAYGLFNNLDLVLSIPFIRASSAPSDTMAEVMDVDGLQDAALLAQWRAWQQKLTGIGTMQAIISLGLSTPLSDYRANSPVAIGHQYSQAESRILLGILLNEGFFANVQAGYFVRGNAEFLDDNQPVEAGVPDALDLQVTVGYASDTWYGDVWLQNQTSGDGPDIMQGPFPVQAISFTRAGANLYYRLPFATGFGVSAGVASTLDGKNIGKATRISGGLVYDFQI